MKKIISDRIATLRKFLERNKLGAYIIPGTDPHLSEYVASHWETRKWLSGFTGSAGTIVVMANEAGLWTDSRYFLQASQQLEETEIRLFKEGLPETPSITEWLCSKLHEHEMVGLDGKMFSVCEVEKIKTVLDQEHIELCTHLDPIGELWTNRPSIPQDTAFIYPLEYAGVSCTDKIKQIREKMRKEGVVNLLTSSLDEIAWTLNIRGNDIKCNPVIISHLLINQKNTYLFIDSEKLTKEVKDYLIAQHIIIKGYLEIDNFLSNYVDINIQISPNKTNYSVFSAINPSCRIIRSNSPIALLKAIRNEQEIKGVHTAMIRDGIALIHFLHWLETAILSGQESEISIDKKLHEFRAQQSLYMGESFDTIAGYKTNGAIVHYSATPESDTILKQEGFLLLDSGAQYLDGTTDITRTIALGKLTEEEKRDYTLVLKGHINLAMAIFPAGTRGTQLDVLARMPLWSHKMNFLHGTGHGVGHFLSVHEGPQSIRMNENPIELQPGMVTSNEPGVYVANSHGVRIENLTLVCKTGQGMFGEYLKFETITLCPICKEGIIKELLTASEINWFNEYHQTVYEKLSPFLNKTEQEWLKVKTASI